MIDYEMVDEAKTDPAKLLKIYNQVFYDGKKPKLRMWLIKKGISYYELDDVETEMKLSFLAGVKKYEHDKIEFEKYIWTRFSHTLLNYYQSKKLKKNSIIPFGDISEEVVFNIGCLPEKRCQDDFEYLFTLMTRYEATICRLIYYNGWEKQTIINHLEVSSNFYDKCLVNIRKIISKYMTD
jgi:hypothetical protein